MVDMKQEGGRAGRRPEGLIVEDFYCVMISLEGFIHLFLRILNPNESIHDSSYRKEQLANLISVPSPSSRLFPCLLQTTILKSILDGPSSS
jgi:hypothetical protein